MRDAKLLKDSEVCNARKILLAETHMRSLTDFVWRLRCRFEPRKIPNFDPLDGGVEAEVLFLLEAPGPQAVKTCFVSRDNPDETAKNFLELCDEAGIRRKRSIVWNVVPWYVGADSQQKIRPVTKRDIAEARPALNRLVGCEFSANVSEARAPLLPSLRAIVLVGRKAQMARNMILQCRRGVEIFDSPHPSPLFCNRKEGNRSIILRKLLEVAEFLG